MLVFILSGMYTALGELGLDYLGLIPANIDYVHVYGYLATIYLAVFTLSQMVMGLHLKTLRRMLFVQLPSSWLWSKDRSSGIDFSDFQTWFFGAKKPPDVREVDKNTKPSPASSDVGVGATPSPTMPSPCCPIGADAEGSDYESTSSDDNEAHARSAAAARMSTKLQNFSGQASDWVRWRTICLSFFRRTDRSGYLTGAQKRSEAQGAQRQRRFLQIGPVARHEESCCVCGQDGESLCG